jgi:uncharacterized membrane protein
VTNLLIALLVVGLLVARQLRPRRAREDSAARFVLILAVIGIVDAGETVNGHRLGTETLLLVAGGLVIGAAFGAVRAATMRVWRDAEGVAWRQGTWLTAVLWIVSLAAHLGIDVVVDRTTDIDGFSSATILIYLAVTLGAQRELVRARAARIPSGESTSDTAYNVGGS